MLQELEIDELQPVRVKIRGKVRGEDRIKAEVGKRDNKERKTIEDASAPLLP